MLVSPMSGITFPEHIGYAFGAGLSYSQYVVARELVACLTAAIS